jgi:hypothetical protein
MKNTIGILPPRRTRTFAALAATLATSLLCCVMGCIDLRRYHAPKIVQKKVPVPPTARVQLSTMEAKAKKGISVKGDTTAASRKLETSPPPGKKPRR